MSRSGSILLPALGAATGAAAVDQGTKWIILNLVMVPPQIIPVLSFFNLQLGFNTGVSFGMFADRFAGAPLLLAALNLALVGLLVLWIIRSKSRSEAIALGLIIGGALGNVADRVRFGVVVDFLDLYYGNWHWPTFNTADVAITIGEALLIVPAFLRRRPPEVVRSGDEAGGSREGLPIGKGDSMSAET